MSAGDTADILSEDPNMPQKSKNWIVTTSADRPIQRIAKDLEAAGFSIGNVNDEIKSISGAAGDDVVEKLRSISGVVDVSADEPVDVGPPDSSDTW
jgi:hypothetical protein